MTTLHVHIDRIVLIGRPAERRIAEAIGKGSDLPDAVVREIARRIAQVVRS